MAGGRRRARLQVTSRDPKQDAKLDERGAWLLEHVAVRVAAKLVAARPGLALAPPVPLPGVAGAVVAVAVELDRHVVVGGTASRFVPVSRG
jgi:hypothetical protein